jgi:hypothetical protein
MTLTKNDLVKALAEANGYPRTWLRGILIKVGGVMKRVWVRIPLVDTQKSL